jgi:pyruvate dehydrogenase E1 component alpha subunit
MIGQGEVERVEALLRRAGLPVKMAPFSADEYWSAMSSDKKVKRKDRLCPTGSHGARRRLSRRKSRGDRGVPPGRIFAQYMGRVDGLTRGRDGNMHMGDLNLKIVAIISALAATVPVAAGAAMALKYRGSRNIALCYFGDGSTSLGHWHEGVNLAAVQKLPVVWICNNNQYAYSTPLSAQMACANVADRGPAYGMPSEIVDGNDVLAVHEAAGRAIAHARSGAGPYLLECKTFRMTGHSAHDAAHYVPAELFEEWGKRDPIVRLENRMLAEGWADENELQTVRASIRREVDEAVDWAERSPYPDPATLLENVYEEVERP